MITNPYKPTLINRSNPVKRIRWLRRFAILNGMVIFIPVLLAVLAYFLMAANDLHVSGVSVTSGVELAILLIVYVAIPDIILFALWLWARESSNQSTTID